MRLRDEEATTAVDVVAIVSVTVVDDSSTTVVEDVAVTVVCTTDMTRDAKAVSMFYTATTVMQINPKTKLMQMDQPITNDTVHQTPINTVCFIDKITESRSSFDSFISGGHTSERASLHFALKERDDGWQRWSVRARRGEKSQGCLNVIVNQGHNTVYLYSLRSNRIISHHPLKICPVLFECVQLIISVCLLQ